jgi:predicted RNA binding protein YcfA (HicA-like mRNA interferase family)
MRLRKAGFEGPFGGGKHVTMRHPDSRTKIPIPIHGGKDIPVGTLRAMLREAGISTVEWEKL